MGTYIKYSCDECGFEYEHDSEIFWIDDNLNLHVSQLLFSTSSEKSKSLASGYYHEYFCYECNNFIEEFLITDNPSDLDYESIIKIIEGYDDNLKIIKFDDKFQKCLTCSQPLEYRSYKLFSFNNNDEFSISDEDYTDYTLFEKNKNDKFIGVYYGYYCDECSQQINKFIVKENSSGMDENTIRLILEEHTNDLTVLIFDCEKICPNCGRKAEFIEDSSQCPNCKKGSLIIKEVVDVD